MRARCSRRWRQQIRLSEIGAALLLAALVPQTAHAQEQAPCTHEARDCSAAALKRHVVKSRAYWEGQFALPPEQRVGPAPAEMIEFMTLDNVRNSVANRPRSAALTPEFMRDVRQALAELPAAVKRRLTDKLAGIQFAVDFGGTGWTDAIDEADGSERAGFVVLDSAILSDKTANAWFTWKESSPFKPQPGFELVGEIEDKSDDSRKNAIQYILLHELAHVLSIGEKIHPPWTIEPKEVKSTADFSFFSLSWTLNREANQYATVYDAAFPERKDVVFYFGAKIPGDHMVGVYDKLEITSFPSLYAVSHPGDDWAEAFVTYVHTVMMNKPLAIRIYAQGKLAKEYRACWTEKRCEEKRNIIERFLDVN